MGETERLPIFIQINCDNLALIQARYEVGFDWTISYKYGSWLVKRLISKTHFLCNVISFAIICNYPISFSLAMHAKHAYNSMKNMNCDWSKSGPHMVHWTSKFWILLNYKSPSENYVVLKLLTPNQNTSRTYYITNFKLKIMASWRMP